MAHCADAEPSIKFTKAHIKINKMKTAGPVKPISCKKVAPLIAKILPKLVQPKNATNCAAKKT